MAFLPSGRPRSIVWNSNGFDSWRTLDTMKCLSVAVPCTRVPIVRDRTAAPDAHHDPRIVRTVTDELPERETARRTKSPPGCFVGAA